MRCAVGPSNGAQNLGVTRAAMIGLLHQFLTRSFSGRAIQAVSQDPVALRLMGVSPTRIKTLAFGLATATAAIAGSLLIIIQPVEPSIGRDFIGRAFAVVVLGGMDQFTSPSAEVVLHPAEYRTGELRYPMGPAKQ